MKHLTVEQTAEELGLTPKAVRQRIARGQLPFRKLGKRVLIPVTELKTFLATLPGRTAKEAVAAVEEGQ
jgi:excisionase family DNA binding protein